MSDTPEYDVALSFAGTDREYVEQVASAAKTLGIRVFYDRFETAELWGKDLYEHLHYVYSKAARFCVMFVSQSYADRLWTTHERRAAQERAFSEFDEYLLPARFDDTEVPGLRSTIGYVDLRDTRPAELAEMIRQKLGPLRRNAYVPPYPDRLFETLGCTDPDNQEQIANHANSFLGMLRRMEVNERWVLFLSMVEACPSELPENAHIYLSYLSRLTDLSIREIQETYRGLRTLGISTHVRTGHDAEDELDDEPLLVISWRNMSVSNDDFSGTETGVVHAMLRLAAERYCEGCFRKLADHLDFSYLSSQFYDPESAHLPH